MSEIWILPAVPGVAFVRSMTKSSDVACGSRGARRRAFGGDEVGEPEAHAAGVGLDVDRVDPALFPGEPD